MTRAVALITAFQVQHSHAGCNDGYYAILDYKTGMIVENIEALAESGESGRFTCKATEEMWFKVYQNGERYNAGKLWDFIDWNVRGAHCTIPSPIKQKDVSVEYTNLETERTVTVWMNAKPYFYAVNILHVSEQGRPATSCRLVRYYYSLLIGFWQGMMWFVAGVGTLITLIAIGKVFLIVLAAVV